jgi:hypothetical protein
VTDTSKFDLPTKTLEAEEIWSISVSNEWHFTLEDVRGFRTYLLSYCSTETNIPKYDLTTKAVGVQVSLKSVGNKGHFTLEDVPVFRTYVPSYCSRVTDTSHFYLHGKALEAEQLWSKSVSNEGHFTFEDVTITPISHRIRAS